MLLKVFLSLYSSRIILNALGVEDYGIYSVVYGLVAVLVTLNSSLVNVIQRYLNIGLAKENNELTQTYFSQGFTILCIFSLIVIILGETIGLWFVMNKLVIPVERINATFWVYQCVLIMIVCEINQSLYVADIIANEDMNIYAYLSILDAFAKLCVALFIHYLVDVDALVVYAILLLMVAFAMCMTYKLYCKRKYGEYRTQWILDKQLLREMGRFVGYNAFGSCAYAASYQGVNVILNLFFGTIVNAAKGIATQVTAALNGFTYGILTAFKPSIITAYSVGNHTYLVTLFENCSKYSYLLTLMFVLPISFNIDFVLNMWLGIVPNNTKIFVLLSMIDMLIFSLSQPIWIVVTATSKIKKNQFYGRLFTLLTLPLSYVILLYYQNEYLPLIITIIMQLFYFAYTLNDVRLQLQFKFSHYYNYVIKPCVIITILCMSILYILGLINFKETMLSVISESLIICFSIIVFTYLVLEKQEKQRVSTFLQKKLQKH